MSFWNGSAWLGIEIGPEPLRHERVGGLRGITVRECAVCGCATSGVSPVRIVELLARPAHRVPTSWGYLVVEGEVAGWITSCLPERHVVWAGLWELVYPGPQRVPRWESRSVPSEQRHQLRREAFAVGGDAWIGTREPTRYADEAAAERLYGKMTEPDPEPVQEPNELVVPDWGAEDAAKLVRVFRLETSSVWVTGAAFAWPGPDADEREPAT